MNADELKTLTTNALDQLRTALEQGHSERLTSLLKTMARLGIDASNVRDANASGSGPDDQ